MKFKKTTKLFVLLFGIKHSIQQGRLNFMNVGAFNSIRYQ